jgi:hypothetical protein
MLRATASRPIKKSSGTKIFLMPASAISRICFTVIRLSFGNDDFGRFVAGCQTLLPHHEGAREQPRTDTPFLLMIELIEFEERSQNLFVGQSNSFEQNGYRHLAAAVDAEVEDVFGIEFKVEP